MTIATDADPHHTATPEATPPGAAERDAARAAAGGVGKDRYVRDIFTEIAPRYDLLNHVLSLNIDRGWRRDALAAMRWERRPDGVYLDLCAGTLDVGAALANTAGFTGHVIGADFAVAMLRGGRGKAARGALSPVGADALALPIARGALDGAIVAFGIRNVDDLDGALAEVRRVLKRGSRFVILEFSTPPHPLVRAAYHAYFHHVLPFIGRVISGHRTAYRYLPMSVAHFPPGGALADRMRRVGFDNVTWRPLTLGIAAIHIGEAA